MNSLTKIAGSKNVDSWKTLKTKIINDPHNNEIWEYAFSSLLSERVNTRYFEPINAIAGIPFSHGKGFSIITIYCSLIEFFETLLKGYDFIYPNYVDKSSQIAKSSVSFKKGQPCNLTTSEIFINFLTQNEPFKNDFDQASAKSFYLEVRCAILHQAETKGGWLVKNGRKSDRILLEKTQNEKHLHWQALKEAFNIFLNVYYKKNLLSNKEIQDNFIFKWDKICRI